MHSWQDVVLAISVLAFNVALVPSLVGKQKPRVATSVLTAAFLIPELVVFISLSLWYSFTMTAINATFWTVLAIQRSLQLRGKSRR